MAENRTEQELVNIARDAESNARWAIGEAAAVWTSRYSRGRTDADFGALIGMSPDQVFQRRRVWETFSSIRAEFPRLSWSHFYAALAWEDALECLRWSLDMEAPVAEMRAWRRAMRGEDFNG